VRPARKQLKIVPRPDNPDAVLPPWNFTVSDTTSISALGYEYVLAAHVFPTDNKMALVRFRSADTAVHPDVLADHGRAEIRLHAVQFVPRPGFYIRAFLNTPDAGLATQTQGNPNFVGQVNMFTGSCVGGPGHCDVPEPPTDDDDDCQTQAHDPWRTGVQAMQGAVETGVCAHAVAWKSKLISCPACWTKSPWI